MACYLLDRQPREMAVSRNAAPQGVTPLDAALHGAGRHILPWCLLAFLFCFLDRINVGYASLTMNADLGLGPAAFGFGSSIFYLGYIGFELPSNAAFNRFGARLWLGRIMLTWGLVSAGMAFVQGETSFYVMRFLLGAAEAGFIPGIMLYLRGWFPDSRLGRATGLCFLAIPLASVIGGPLAVALFQLDGVMGLRGWQWMFLIEAAPSLLIGLVYILMLPDGPDDAAFLAAAERAALAEAMRREAAGRAGLGFWASISNPYVILLGVINMGVLAPNMTLTLWLPQILKAQGFTTTQTGFVASIPYLAGMLGMLIWPRLSDRLGNRIGMAAGALAIAASGVAAAAFVSDPWLKVACFTVAAFGTYGGNPTFWTLPARVFGGSGAGAGLAMVSCIGTLSSAFGPWTVGWIKQATGSFDAGLYLIAAVTATGCLLTAALSAARRHLLARTP